MSSDESDSDDDLFSYNNTVSFEENLWDDDEDEKEEEEENQTPLSPEENEIDLELTLQALKTNKKRSEAKKRKRDHGVDDVDENSRKKKRRKRNEKTRREEIDEILEKRRSSQDIASPTGSQPHHHNSFGDGDDDDVVVVGHVSKKDDAVVEKEIEEEMKKDKSFVNSQNRYGGGRFHSSSYSSSIQTKSMRLLNEMSQIRREEDIEERQFNREINRTKQIRGNVKELREEDIILEGEQDKGQVIKLPLKIHYEKENIDVNVNVKRCVNDIKKYLIKQRNWDCVPNDIQLKFDGIILQGFDVFKAIPGLVNGSRLELTVPQKAKKNETKKQIPLKFQFGERDILDLSFNFDEKIKKVKDEVCKKRGIKGKEKKKMKLMFDDEEMDYNGTLADADVEEDDMITVEF